MNFVFVTHYMDLMCGPRKFYTGMDVSDRSEANIVSLFNISETNSCSQWLVNLCWSWDLVWQKLSHSKLSHTFCILYVRSLACSYLTGIGEKTGLIMVIIGFICTNFDSVVPFLLPFLVICMYQLEISFLCVSFVW